LPNINASDSQIVGPDDELDESCDESASQYIDSESNTGEDEECASFEDGIYPIPDTGSEMSIPSNIPVDRGVGRIPDIGLARSVTVNHRNSSGVDVNFSKSGGAETRHVPVETNPGLVARAGEYNDGVGGTVRGRIPQFALDHRLVKDGGSESNLITSQRDVVSSTQCTLGRNFTLDQSNLTINSTSANHLNQNLSRLNPNLNSNPNQNKINSNYNATSTNTNANGKTGAASRMVHFADEDRAGTGENLATRPEPRDKRNPSDVRRTTGHSDEMSGGENERDLIDGDFDEGTNEDYRTASNEMIVPFDDIPVAGAAGGGRRKTFEELIEEELRKESTVSIII